MAQPLSSAVEWASVDWAGLVATATGVGMAAGALVVAFRRATKKNGTNGANGANGASATANASQTITHVFRLVEELQEENARKQKEIARLEGRISEQQKTIVRLQEQLRGSPERP